ncbi:DNA-directed RNA polymerase subunit omega [Tropheryma whipplei]|nr:DNA-directed RNA polymerase subunit omega [Tropheryma whipplei]Q820D7.1 RecName: Full=DNA-directed RNA polymerase subunit omega; Short=RNAP omega subunit; AltName: Full=RNA polymerase omega subunit; AltName: Full=Transcriptase subunit omega [Tropheryma whipplei TW08/27]MCO8182377.1 DNA-directed RNA polymerase subunit omega [Tropheryma whipplei]MCO8190147.1 DNA-directed RNA polymerase subunit omega [Tropheryma whipplei]CAD67078.1 DNA-directed RNA polymerase omega chain [Tropheryma whipplei TW
MEEDRGIADPPLDSLLSRSGSKYGLVIYAAKRARQIDQYYIDLHEGSFYAHVGPLVSVDADDKSLTVAMREIAEDKLDLKSSAAE